MTRDFAKGNSVIEEGALFRRVVGGAMTEMAEVVEIGRDRMGIPHVRYNMQLLRGGYAAGGHEQRTLALDTFYARYRERIERRERGPGNS